MYSIVLMTALTMASAGPQFGRHGCYSTCHGCYSTCAGCNSCRGPVVGYGAAGGCYGYHGGCYGAFGVVHGIDHNHGGCTSCYCYQVPMSSMPAVRTKDAFPPINPPVKKKPVNDAEEVAPPKEKVKVKPEIKKDDKLDDKKKLTEEGVQARAKVRIDVPSGGKLFVDGRPINVASGIRTFQTPLLAAGQAYFYDIRVEVDLNGILRQDERRLVVRSGQDVAVSFQHLTQPGTATAQVPR
ncbi:MAG: TIGR03000 domain-containing protein [Gemmataceae bacterium]|nr:TIGR03000 domain-containing protein [Gemmataceae bacterium]